MKLYWTKYIIGIILITAFMSCATDNQKNFSDQEVATSWAEMTTYIMQYTPANSPTFASRSVGYIGLTMYESIVNGYPTYQSLSGQLNGLEALPTPNAEQEYFWPAALNAGQATIIKRIYNQTSDKNKQMIDSLEMVIGASFEAQGIDDEVIDRSAELGRNIAEAIFTWSETDGGHRGYLNNFDKEFEHPVFPGSWKPPLYAQSFSHHPLHPYWGDNRTFLGQNASLPLPEIIPYDTNKGSPYYQQFIEVYEKEKSLTQEEKEIALWWGDDPDDTFTPPGHSYYLATLAIKTRQPELIVCAETYARIGLAVADAFINCWKWKYHFFSERPNTFIPQFIDSEWESFWPDPPFPSFPSGHAIQAAAAATVLADVYGNEFTFTDTSHVGRPRDELRETDFVARNFTNFWDIALETADSRFYGGIHTYQDNKVGLDEGARIAGHVNELNWKEKKVN